MPFSEGLPYKLPGRELGDEELFQILEEEIMTPADYERILDVGYGRWYMDYLVALQPDLPAGRRGRAIVTWQFIRMALRIRGNARRLAKRGVTPAFSAGCYPPFDYFSLARSMERFSLDLYEVPELVQRASDAAIEPTVATTLQTLMLTRGTRVSIYPMRSSATFISPKMFEERVLEQLKRLVEAFTAKGLTPLLHCDGNWGPMLHLLRELPRASCILELDNDTDIFEAKEVLGDWMCLKGNVPAVMLAFGEPGEVEAYCQRLISEVGHDGGFILSSGCEVPLNAKLENVEAMLRVGRA